MNGIPTYRFIPNPKLFAGPSKNPENRCFCRTPEVSLVQKLTMIQFDVFSTEWRMVRWHFWFRFVHLAFSFNLCYHSLSQLRSLSERSSCCLLVSSFLRSQQYSKEQCRKYASGSWEAPGIHRRWAGTTKLFNRSPSNCQTCLSSTF